MPTPTVGNLDLALIGAYFLVVFGIGFYVARQTHSGEDLFLAGRRLGWAPIGLSLFASNISSTTLIGLAGAAYTWGIAVSNYEWMASLILVVFAVFYVPYYLNARISTVPEFLEKRFDRRSRRYFSVLTLFSNIVVDTAGSLFEGAVVIKVFFPDVDLLTACLLLAIVAGIYTAAGGLAAVVYTDVLQAIVLLVGACLLTWFAFAEVGFSWERVVDVAGSERLSLMLPLDDPNLPWLGTLIGVPVLGFYFWCTNQFIVQRVLGAWNVYHARRGALFAGLLKLPVLFIMVLPGTMAIALFPELENGDMVFPLLITELLPSGILGIVLAGLIAAIMSSIDSTLNSASALFTLDFVRPWRPNLSDRKVALIGRLAILGFMLLAVLIAPVIDRFGGLFHYLQTALAFLVPPVVALFVIGLFWRRATATAAFLTLVGGHLMSGLFFVLSVSGVLELHFTVMAGLLFLISCVLFVAISLLGRAPDAAAIEQFTFSRETIADTGVGRAWGDYRLFATVLILLTVWLVVTFW
jgi:SSS family solute:Na+ symporter